MKKVFALIAVAAMMLSCGGNGQNGTNGQEVVRFLWATSMVSYTREA